MTSTRQKGDAGRKAPVEPRPSASLILLNDRNEVLMVQRNMLGAFAGAFVSCRFSLLVGKSTDNQLRFSQAGSSMQLKMIRQR